MLDIKKLEALVSYYGPADAVALTVEELKELVAAYRRR